MHRAARLLHRAPRLLPRAAPLLAAIMLWLASPAVAGPAGRSYFPRPCPPIRYHSAPHLGAQRVCMNLGVPTHGTQPGTFLFLSPGGDVGKRGAGIYRDDGTLVWWLQNGAPIDQNLTEVHYQGQPYLALLVGHRAHHHDYGVVQLYNRHYERVGTITAGGRFGSSGLDLHEFRITPQGDALLAIKPRVEMKVDGHRETVFNYVVQKVSLVHDAKGIHTGRVLFQWSALAHVPVSQSHVPAPRGRPWDYFHGNAVAQDTDGNLLVSSRNTWGIYKINATTGRIMWQVGARGDHQLPEPWCYQHDIAPLGDNRYSLFDDGGGDPGCTEGSTAHASRGLIVQVDASSSEAGVRLIRAYPHQPAIYAGICGSVQRLADGDALVDWGDVPEVTEYAPSGAMRMDLSLTNWSYRAFRFPWIGQPRTRPALAAKRTGVGTRLWASWNGSTVVAAWRVLAGPSAGHLVPVTGAHAKTHFETQISLPEPYPWVAVQALSSHGAVLATSRAIAPS